MILTKMLGMKIFLLLSLSVISYSVPQPELRIIIHLHQDNFQPGPVGNRILNPNKHPSTPARRDGRRPSKNFESEIIYAPEQYIMNIENPEPGNDYSDDKVETVDENVMPNEDVIPNEEIELDGETKTKDTASNDPMMYVTDDPKNAIHGNPAGDYSHNCIFTERCINYPGDLDYE